MGNIMDREDIHEQIELSKIVDIEHIPYQVLSDAFVNFTCSVLITDDSLQKLNIDYDNGEMIRHYAFQGKAFLNKKISKKTLVNEGNSAWEVYDRLPDDSASKNLLRIVISCLGDEEDDEFDIYGSGETLGAFFFMLLNLGSGYCSQFRYYFQEKMLNP